VESDCTCGVPFVVQIAQQTIAGLPTVTHLFLSLSLSFSFFLSFSTYVILSLFVYLFLSCCTCAGCNCVLSCRFTCLSSLNGSCLYVPVFRGGSRERDRDREEASCRQINTKHCPNARTTTQVQHVVADAIHSVSDINPIHLPHIWLQMDGKIVDLVESERW
jgi:hypothetical protein